jgi:hypothetical protein
MPKKLSSAKEAVIKTLSSGPAVRIAYPRTGEVLRRPHYTFQIAAVAGAKGVEVSLDYGNWKPCRESLGLWWYDWTGYAKGKHTLLARTIIAENITAFSATRRFSVS